MTLSVFSDKSRLPQHNDLTATLGSTFVFWNELKRLIASKFTPLSVEWGYSSKKTGGDYGSNGRNEPFST